MEENTPVRTTMNSYCCLSTNSKLTGQCLNRATFNTRNSKNFKNKNTLEWNAEDGHSYLTSSTFAQSNKVRSKQSTLLKTVHHFRAFLWFFCFCKYLIFLFSTIFEQF